MSYSELIFISYFSVACRFRPIAKMYPCLIRLNIPSLKEEWPLPWHTDRHTEAQGDYRPLNSPLNSIGKLTALISKAVVYANDLQWGRL